MRSFDKILTFFILIVFATLSSCQKKASKTFEFLYSTEFQVPEYEIYEGINTLANLGLGDAFTNKLKEENSSLEQLLHVSIKSVQISMLDSIISFSDINNFTVDILGTEKSTPMKTVANVNDVRANEKSATMQFTSDNLKDYFLRPDVLFIPSGEAKRDIEESFGMKIEIIFEVGIK